MFLSLPSQASPGGSVKEVRGLPLKAATPMNLREDKPDRSTEVSWLPLKAPPPMEVREAGKSTEVSGLVEKAKSPMEVREAGKSTEVRDLSRKAATPMEVMGCPSSVFGMMIIVGAGLGAV